MNASVRSSGLRSSAIRRSPSPRSTPIAAGLLSSAASRFPRVCSESSQRDALAGEQQRVVEVVLDERPRAEALGLRRDRLGAGAAALLERDRAGDDGQREQGGEAGQHRPQPALRALARRAARGHERALGRR